jgi:hypothetical protein
LRGLSLIFLAVAAACSDPREDCEARDGEWVEPHIGADTGSCALPTSDAGKECSDGDECEGFCEAVHFEDGEEGAPVLPGECSAWTTVDYCPPTFVDGMAVEACP